MRELSFGLSRSILFNINEHKTALLESQLPLGQWTNCPTQDSSPRRNSVSELLSLATHDKPQPQQLPYGPTDKFRAIKSFLKI